MMYLWDFRTIRRGPDHYSFGKLGPISELNYGPFMVRNHLQNHPAPQLSLRSWPKPLNPTPHTLSTTLSPSPITPTTTYLHSPQTYSHLHISNTSKKCKLHSGTNTSHLISPTPMQNYLKRTSQRPTCCSPLASIKLTKACQHCLQSYSHFHHSHNQK